MGWIDGVILDVTGRKAAEHVLIEQRALLEALMDNTPDHIYFKDANSRFTMISAALARAFGLDDAVQAVGTSDLDYFLEEHARPALLDEQEIIRTGRPMVELEEKETWPDGRETWVATTKLPRTDARGRIIGTFGISRDITRRKLVEAALRDSEIRLRAITDSAQDAIVMMDPRGAICYWNPAAERVLGYTAAEAIGQDLHALFVPDRYPGRATGGHADVPADRAGLRGWQDARSRGAAKGRRGDPDPAVTLGRPDRWRMACRRRRARHDREQAYGA